MKYEVRDYFTKEQLFGTFRKYDDAVYCVDDLLDDELEEDEREELKRKIRKGLSPKSAFTAFKRQIVKDIPYLYEDFKEYIPLSK